MNIYELNALISSIQEKPTHHDILPFYLKMRKDLMAKLSLEVQAIINAQ